MPPSDNPCGPTSNSWQLTGEGTGGVGGDATAVFESGPWRLSVTVGPVAGQVRCTELTLRPTSPGADQTMTAVLLRSIPLGRLVGEAIEQGQEWQRVTDEHYDAEVAGVQQAITARARQDDDLYFARLAYLYLATVHRGHRAPLRHLAATLDRDPEALRAQIKVARARGLLTRGVSGRATGRLTDRARQLLAEANQET